MLRAVILPLTFIATLLSCFIFGEIHEGNLNPEDFYVGCFAGKLRERSGVVFANISHTNMSILMCFSHCKLTRKTYAALTNGSRCTCINGYDTQLMDNKCNKVCLGKDTEYCGGPMMEQLSTYSLFAVCPIGTFGVRCNRICHCKGYTPCHRLTGHCVSGCHSSYTNTTCGKKIMPEFYLGCYADKPYDQDLSYVIRTSRHTTEACSDHCAIPEKTYAAIQFFRNCLCGDKMGKYGLIDEEKCNAVCPHNHEEMCGGFEANSIYTVCPPGSYGENCLRQCHCLDDKPCKFNGGSCRPEGGGCKPGFNGPDCNTRDCSQHNGGCGNAEICVEVSLKSVKFTRCRCSPGYQRKNLAEECRAPPDDMIVAIFLFFIFALLIGLPIFVGCVALIIYLLFYARSERNSIHIKKIEITSN